MSVFKKLNELRLRVLRKGNEKSGSNSFAGYSYFELKDFMPDVLVWCAELGIIGLVSIDRELARIRIQDTDDISQFIDFTTPYAGAQLKGCHPVQNEGASQTYFRRYMWGLALELVEGDPIDSAPPVEELDEEEMTDVMEYLLASESMDDIRAKCKSVWSRCSLEQREVLTNIGKQKQLEFNNANS